MSETPSFYGREGYHLFASVRRFPGHWLQIGYMKLTQSAIGLAADKLTSSSEFRAMFSTGTVPNGTGADMSKQKPTEQQVLDAKDEGRFAKSARKASFAETCSQIRKWADDAEKRYLDGQSPDAKRVAWLAQLVKELATGTAETRTLTFTVKDIANAKIANLEPGSLTDYIKAWGEPVTPKSGRREGTFNLMKALPILKRQFPDTDDDDWNALIIKAAGQ